MNWLNEAWHDPVWSKVIAAAILAVLASAGSLFIPAVRDWATASVGDISRLHVIGWCAFGFVAGVALATTIWKLTRSESSNLDGVGEDPPAVHGPDDPNVSRFDPFEVVDMQHKWSWHVKKDPATWLDRLPYNVTVDDVIDGPFHVDRDCAERVDTPFSRNSHRQVIADRCPRCGQSFYVGVAPDLESCKVAVMDELRRLNRIGEDVAHAQVLQHVGYRKRIRPPDA